MPNERAVDVVVSVADWMKANGIAVPGDLAAKIAELKSRGGWERIIWDDVREFYYEEQSVSDFIDSMTSTIESQLTRAWNEGMRNNGLDPASDMKPEWDAELQAIIDEEYNHVLDFAQAIEDARRDGRPVTQLRSRTELWPARYDDVVNRAMIATKPDDLFVWVLGATEQHCATCAALNGWIATGAEWEQSGYHPQQPPNDALECGGWRCDCQMQRVDDKQARSMGVPSV
jgi:hypothetical protein